VEVDYKDWGILKIISGTLNSLTNQIKSFVSFSRIFNHLYVFSVVYGIAQDTEHVC